MNDSNYIVMPHELIKLFILINYRLKACYCPGAFEIK